MLERVEINDAAAIALLKSPEIVADLERRGKQIAAAAQQGRYDKYDVDTHQTPTRAHVRVTTATNVARVEEARNRSLSKALDAGRD
jgi:hypothetical protein